ncbi:unnamed protein product [Allacma fusca]|uniref:MOSC domain-containing protein n=1 Tax=Allacma fusca TaxID=39272 RepID=A0A8J2LL02_9HEXA|nr:unnamed protein product [Allacma fusca]
MLDFDIGGLQAAFSILGVTTASFASYLWVKKRNSTEECPSLKPTKWVKVGNIASLILYPIKSCKGIYVDKAFVTPLGLQGRKGSRAFRDRTFLVVNAKGREVCQEQFPTMVLIEPTILDDDRISLSAPNMEPLIFSLPENKPSNRTVCSLGKADKNIPCLDCGDEVARFFSEFLGKNLRLVNHIEGETKEFRQLTKDEIVYPTFTKDVLGVFQNESAYLLIADESVSELNKFMNVQSTHKNFRPTVLIENIQEPFGELKWSYAKLGSDDDAPVLKTGRPCDRCPIITNDPEVGVMDRDREILKTLRELEYDMGNENANTRMKGRPVMGLRMGLYGEPGIARKGDPVYTALL